MNNTLKYLYKLGVTFGLDPVATLRALKGLPYYFRNRAQFNKQAKQSTIIFPLGRPMPCLGDRFAVSGVAKGHYFHQDLLVANQIFHNNPNRHVDVGSRIDGFVAHVAAFRKIEVFDIRQLDNRLENIQFSQLDFMQPIPEKYHNYCDSLSCLHALEHFGLGRYGDPIDFTGYLKGFNNLYAMLKPEGKLYLSVPIGQQRIEFDGHRVFSIQYLLELINHKYTLDRFSYVDDNGDLHHGVSLTKAMIENNVGCTYGCGIFELNKLNIGY